MWITSNKKPWDPSVLDADNKILVPPCWDGQLEVHLFHETMENERSKAEEAVGFAEDVAELEEVNAFTRNVGETTMFVKCFALTLGLPILFGETIMSVFNQALKSVTLMLKRKWMDIKEHCPKFGWRVLGIAKKSVVLMGWSMIELSSVIVMFWEHWSQQKLRQTMEMDTLFCDTPETGGIKYAQLFVGRNSKYALVYGLKKASEAQKAVENFIQDKNDPIGLRHDNARKQIGRVWIDILQAYCIFTKNTAKTSPQWMLNLQSWLQAFAVHLVCFSLLDQRNFYSLKLTKTFVFKNNFFSHVLHCIGLV